MPWSRPVAVGLLLPLVVALGAFFRLDGVNWDANQHLHPDERFLTMVVGAERWPASVGDYLDESRSPLNPRNVGFEFFAYGTLPTTLVKAVAVLSGSDDYDGIVLVGRRLSALADLGTLVLLFVTGRRLYDDARIGLVAAFLYAACVLPIQHAHFFVVDTFAVFFVTAAISALAFASTGRVWLYAVAGACFGLALACKLSVVTFAVVIAVVAWPGQSLTRFFARGAVAAIAGFVAFRLAQPDAFSGPGLFDIMPAGRWLADVAQSRRLVSGEVDFPPAIQWAGRTPFWFAWTNLVVWGMGPALGLTAWAGWATAAWRLVRRTDARHLIPVVWAGVLFLHLGGQFVMTGRYLLPIYPMLALLAAWLLIYLTRSIRGSRLAVALGAVTVVATLLWALAFTSVYRRPHTRVEASSWIHEHIPPGARIASEHWDDRLPLPIPGSDPRRYLPLELANYDDDTPAKLDGLVGDLDTADYVILSSNRLSDSIPRLPLRYPMTSRYYELLLSGALGFERVAEFTSYPALGPLEFPDQAAEEAFSVYDHPRVQIFARSSTWSAARARDTLGSIDWAAIVRMNPHDAGRLASGLMLTPEARTDVRTSGTWTDIFDPDDAANAWPITAWLLTVEIIGLAAFPLVALVFRSLPDRGWLLSKSVGLLLVAYLSWLFASLRWLPFTRGTLVFATAAIAAVASTVAWRHRATFVSFWQAKRRLLVGEQCLFWCCFAGFLLIRAGNPDLWHPYFGGEKPMDFAFLNAVVRSDYFPAYDPWFAGGYINYYYFGFVLVAALTELAGIVPQVAYNLAVPTFFAFTAAAAFTVVHGLAGRTGEPRSARVGPALSGLAAIVFVAVIGNLAELRVMARAILGGSWSAVPNWFWYWNATRAIPHAPAEAPPITEFPFFTFLYGDLHAHMLALPYTIVVLALVAHALIDRAPPPRRWPREALLVGSLGLVTGTLYATNTWDYPTAVTITAVVLTARAWIWREEATTLGSVVWQAGWRTLSVVIIGLSLFSPFVRAFAGLPGGVHIWTGSTTPPGAYLVIHGLFLFLLASLAVGTGWGRRRSAGQPQAPSPRSLFLWIVAGMGVLLTLMVEIVVIDGDIGRMNTVFKFYFQAWVLLAIAAALSLGPLTALWVRIAKVPGGGARRIVRTAWLTVLVVLLLASAAYVPLATRARWRDRFDRDVGFTLDGQAYMKTSTHEEEGRPFDLAPDLAAIRWLQTALQGTPVIVEGHTPQYRWGGRISANTGLPTILGWSWHERQQRTALPGDPIAGRERDVRALYENPDSEAVLPLMDRYRAEYVIVGSLERILYPAAGLAKFESDVVWQQVFAADGVRIYRLRRRDGGPE